MYVCVLRNMYPYTQSFINNKPTYTHTCIQQLITTTYCNCNNYLNNKCNSSHISCNLKKQRKIYRNDSCINLRSEDKVITLIVE